MIAETQKNLDDGVAFPPRKDPANSGAAEHRRSHSAGRVELGHHETEGPEESEYFDLDVIVDIFSRANLITAIGIIPKERTVIEAHDEELHDPDTLDEHWQESYYFNFADHDGRTFGLTRIGYQLHRGRADAVLLTMSDGRAEYIYPAVHVEVPAVRPNARDELRIKRLTFTNDEPLSQWRIRLEGRHRLDLEWRAFTPAFEFHQGEGAAELNIAQRHFEQSGRVSGRIAIKGKARDFEGVGHRDKSWGTRDWAGIKGWNWISAQFGDALAFNATEVLGEGGSASDGFVFFHGENRPLQRVSIGYTWGRQSHVPKRTELLLADDAGRKFEVRADALAQFPLARKGLYIQETHSRFTARVEGVEHHGVGVVEHAWHAGTAGTLKRLPAFASMGRDVLRGMRP